MSSFLSLGEDNPDQMLNKEILLAGTTTRLTDCRQENQGQGFKIADAFVKRHIVSGDQS